MNCLGPERIAVTPTTPLPVNSSTSESVTRPRKSAKPSHNLMGVHDQLIARKPKLQKLSGYPISFISKNTLRRVIDRQESAADELCMMA